MPYRVLAVGDGYLGSAEMADVIGELAPALSVRYVDVDPSDRPPLEGLREYQGDPRTIGDWLDGEDVLLVHAAPVTAGLLDSHPEVRIVACARGGPVNVDLAAARARGVTVLTTPAKNADAVSDLTMAYLQLLFRRAVPAMRWLSALAMSGETRLDSTFSGALWRATEPRGHTLGLVGSGAIGRRVAERALSAGMHVLIHDPYVGESPPGTVRVDRAELVERSDAVSVHVTATPETRHLADAEFFGAMKRGAFFVNTARESIVDEVALLAALEAGQLGGVALDVCEPDGEWPALARRDDVVLSPHIGGATDQTQQRGLALLVEDLQRIESGKDPLHAARG